MAEHPAAIAFRVAAVIRATTYNTVAHGPCPICEYGPQPLRFVFCGPSVSDQLMCHECAEGANES